jgi:hypothetical protein
MGAVEGRARQSGVIGIAFAHLDLGERVVPDETARQLGEMRTALDAEHGAFGSDVLTEEMQHTAWSAAKIDDTLAGLDTDPLEVCIGIRSKIGDLMLEANFLSLRAP